MAFLSLIIALAASQAIAEPSASCAQVFALAPETADKQRPAQIDDLLQLRDIGTAADYEAPFTISPDGSKLAVALRQARADQNDYCQGIVVIDIATGVAQAPILIHGDLILRTFDLPGLPDYGGGLPITLLPRWSPDGRLLAFLERRDGTTQVMTVAASGGMPQQVTHSAVDVRDIQWGTSSDELLYTARPGIPAAMASVAAEGKRGFRYDARWAPNWRSVPFPAVTPTKRFSITLSSGRVRELGDAPAEQDVVEAVDQSGIAARIEPRDKHLLNGHMDIQVTTVDQHAYSCPEEACGKARELWWRNRSELLYAHRTGWGESLTAIVAWDFKTGRRRRLLETQDRVAGCRAAPSGLICAIESSDAPRKLVIIDYRTGKRQLLYDPNPQWRQIQTGTIRRIFWKNDLGLECYGDLVLPTGDKGGKPVPLVIVGYQSRGFLRGGTGDLFPVFPLAAKGFAVLVHSRPTSIGYLTPVADQPEADRRVVTNWADKRNVNSSILTAIEKLKADNIIDAGRIGLTGFSDGVEKGTYSLVHNSIFKAASFAGCCSDITGVNMMIGPYLSDVVLAMGMPPMAEWNAPRVKEYSLAANAGRVDTPILIQASDREYLNALELEAARRQRGKPVALYVYPDEYHIFWQPVHRRASYYRNLAWFAYHLGGKEDLPKDLSAWLPDELR